MSKRMKQKKPTVVFCELRRPPEEIVNISSQNGAEGVVSRMLPKSHVSHVILNANVSEERFLDMRVSTENKMKKKSMDVHDHFKNTFIKRLERKQQRWMKEDTYVSKNFQLSVQQRSNRESEIPVNLGSLTLPTPPRPATQLLYKRAKYPYVSVSRFPLKTADASGQRTARTTDTLPRISTVPAGGTRTQEPKPPTTSDAKPTELPPTNQRAETASSIATRMTTTTRGRRRAKQMNNHDKRFTELMSFLSPVDAMREQMKRSRLLNFSVQASY
uniref:Uncharacterized protein LOC100183185 n=1 Tax=Phallusia mammillata TaxID=59560 RepID=A0A6F9DIG6_9ASCI|nr:uncharacterized protein LOC100183185 [Phallusia mammillata]